MEAKVSPTLRRRRLGRRIRERRTGRFSGTALATLIGGINQSRLSKVEIGKACLTEVQFDRVVEILELSEVEAGEWRQLWREGNRSGWWSEYLDVVSEHGEMLAGFEMEATRICQYINSHIPALLATEDYLRAVVRSSQLIRPADVPRLIEFRLRRQQKLNDPDVRYTAIIAEGALHRHIGGKAVLADSLRHLLDGKWEANVEILVVPFEADSYSAEGKSFQIMRFDDPEDPEAVFVESGPGGGFLEKAGEVRYYNQLCSVAESIALGGDESRRHVEAILANLGG